MKNPTTHASIAGRIRVAVEFDLPDWYPSDAQIRSYIKSQLNLFGGNNIRVDVPTQIIKPSSLVWMSGPAQAVKKGAYSYGPVPKREQIREEPGDVIVAKDRKTKEIVFCERWGKPYRGKVL